MNRRTSILGIGVLATGLALHGQDTIKQMKVDVDLVLVNVTVTDSHGRFVQGLSLDNFQLYEDKVEQELVTFEREDTPVSMGIVVDRSGSMGGKKLSAAEKDNPAQTALAQASNSAIACLQDSLRDDEYFLIEFSTRTQISADFTSDPSKLRLKLLFLEPGGSTALWDAIYAGIAKLERAQHQRRALLVLTDGDENSSRYSLGQLKGLLKERDVRIYSMGYGRESQFDGFANLVKASGGMLFKSNKPCKELHAELRSQYLVGYRSTNRAADGSWRAIKIRIKPDSLPKGMPNPIVRARAGYFSSRE